MAISFDTIPGDIRIPGSYSEFNFATAQQALPGNSQSMVIIAQKLAAGTLAVETPTQVFSSAEVATHAGTGSIAHLCAIAALKANPKLDLDIVLMDDAVGTQAEGTITIATNATATGTLTVWVGNKRLHLSQYRMSYR
jgi:phage tail sheath gpL-like